MLAFIFIMLIYLLLNNIRLVYLCVNTLFQLKVVLYARLYVYSKADVFKVGVRVCIIVQK